VTGLRSDLDQAVVTKDWFTRDRLARSLAETEGPAALPVLLPLLTTPETDSLRSTLAQLMWTDPPGARAIVVPLLDAPDPALRREALWALGHVVTPADLPRLTVALSDDDPEVRRLAIDSLPSPAADPRVQDLLVTALSDPDAWVRHHAVLGLAWSAPPEVVDQLIPLTTDPSDEVRAVLGEAIGRLAAGSDRHAAATDALLGLMADPASAIRAGAARGLGSLGGPREPLESHAADPDDWVRAAVAAALPRTGPAALPTLRALATDESFEVRWQLAAALGGCRWAGARELLTELAADPSPVVREIVASTLDEPGDQ
jgi:HEAT repeat protein